MPFTMSQSNNATNLVQDGWNNAKLYASTAVADSKSFLNALQAQATTVSSIGTLSGTLGTVSKTIGAYAAPAVPALPSNSGFVAQTAPVEPIFTAITVLDPGTAPTFTATAPAVALPTVPAALSATAPTAPSLPAIAIPTAPTVSLPVAPTLLGITVPTAALLSLPTFTQILPGSPLAADYIFSFADTAYTSTLLDALRTRLQEWVSGAATGLAPAVEQALWERGRARETANASRKMKEAVRAFAMRGFAKPPGMLAVELAEATQAAQDAGSTLSRDISIKQAELEQENRKFAFEQAFKVEAELVTYQNQISQRAFDAAKHAQQVGIDIAQQNIARFTADVQAYSAKVDQWKGAIQSELTKLEKYRSDLEGQRLIGTMNDQAVQIYATRIAAAKTTIDIFKAQVDAVNAQAGINKTQIESFSAQVGAYAETVRAKAAEYDGYATRVRAEVSKVDVFKAQADAYRSQADGFKTLVDAKVAAKGMEIRLGRDVPLDLFKTRTEVYRSAVAAEASRVGAVVDVFDKQAQVYSSQVQGQVGRMGAEAEAYRSEVQYQQASADVKIEVAKANVAAMTQKIGLLIDATKAGAQVTAQMAASALSAVNLSGSISDSMNTSNSAGYSWGDSNSTTTGTSTTTSTGTSTSTSHNYSYTGV